MSRSHRARKRFGQHFLVDPAVIDGIVAAIAPRAGEVLIEIGPGRGAITAALAASGAELHLVEFDRDLAADLARRYAGQASVTVHEADALRFDYAALGTRVRIAGNLPYNISTPLLFHLADQAHSIADMHFMLQKEVVDRMAASPGGRDFGRLTVTLGCRLQVVRLFDVPPTAFEPPPRVMSTVVRMQPRPDAPSIADPALFSRLVAAAFSKRRKTLHNALKHEATDDDLRQAGIDPGRRAETIPVDAWVELANRLARS